MRQDLLAPFDSPISHMLKPASFFFYKTAWPETGWWDSPLLTQPNSIHLSPKQTTQDFEEQGFYAGQLAAEMANILWAAHPLWEAGAQPSAQLAH